MKIFELETISDAQENNRKLLREAGLPTLTESEQEETADQFFTFVAGLKYPDNIGENNLVAGEKYWPFDMASSPQKRLLAITTVSEPATFIKKEGSRLFFAFDNQHPFTFPQEQYADQYEFTATMASKDRVSSTLNAVMLQFKGVWVINAEAYAPPGRLQKIINISD